MTTADFFNVTTPVEDPIREALVEMVMNRYHATPRHQQIELGPSEIGHPCMRKIAQGTMAVPRQNPEYDPLPSIVGTAAHTWAGGIWVGGGTGSLAGGGSRSTESE